MKPSLEAHAFASLLKRLDVDRERAGQRYEELRRVLTRFFEWRNTPFAEEQVDETLDRVARKLDDGIVIENLNAYCYEVARLVSLEALKGPATRQIQLVTTNIEAEVNSTEDAIEKEAHLICLENCLEKLPPQGRELIVEYYQDQKRSKIDRRKALADRLGLKREALANRAQRLRDKLETCVVSCVKQNVAI